MFKASYRTLIANIFDGGKRAFIYIWVSKKWRVIYVGQTNDSRGTLGRAAAHVDSGGTLRKRFEEEIGLPLEDADDLLLLSFPLPQRSEFSAVESSYREAVEYLVQIGLYSARLTLEPAPKIVSRIRCIPTRISDPLIQDSAQNIVSAFAAEYKSS